MGVDKRSPSNTRRRTIAEVARRELERLAAEQGVKVIIDLHSLRADFWPEDESVDDFVRTVRERRGEPRGQ